MIFGQFYLLKCGSRITFIYLYFAGSYICYASNEFGTAASNSVFVRQSTLNSFKEASPKTVSVEEGKPLKIECEAPGGWPKPTVYWMIQVCKYFYKYKLMFLINSFKSLAPSCKHNSSLT